MKKFFLAAMFALGAIAAQAQEIKAVKTAGCGYNYETPEVIISAEIVDEDGYVREIKAVINGDFTIIETYGPGKLKSIDNLTAISIDQSGVWHIATIKPMTKGRDLYWAFIKKKKVIKGVSFSACKKRRVSDKVLKTWGFKNDEKTRMLRTFYGI